MWRNLLSSLSKIKIKRNMENIVCISENIFIVRTQAGYKKAVNSVFGTKIEREEYLNKTPFPKEYPALVILNTVYGGGSEAMTLKWFSLKKLETIVDRMKNPKAEEKQ